MQHLNLKTLLPKTNYHRPLIFNSVLWLLAFVILLYIFSKGKSPIAVDYIYTVTFLVLLAIPVSINFYVLMPRFLKHEKYLAYSIGFITNLIVFALFGGWFFQPILDALFPDYFFISYLSKTNIFIVFSIFLVATSLLKLAEDWFYFNTNENRILRHKNLQVETQLSALRSQINPHFLFNSLNVIYALALDKKQETTKAIVQLSDILRYVIYDSNTDRVTLKDEITLLKNYISFQNHRIKNSDFVTFSTAVENDHFKIYPMLLLPILENSFKYGLLPDGNEEPINIIITQKGGYFSFNISNANLKTKNQMDIDHSGVGLENLKTNLNLVYSDQHVLNITESSERFELFLEIRDEQH